MRRTLLAIALLLCTAPALAEMQARPVDWNVGKERFSGYVVYDDAVKATRPGLVMVPNWLGVNADAVEKAKAIAGGDYVVLVADVYGKAIRPTNAKEAGAAAKGAFADGGVLLRARANEAVRVLQAQAGNGVPVDPSKIGAFGFCFGGTTVLELARSGSDVAGVVSLHGNLETYLPTAGNTVNASVLVLNGADDAGVTDAQIAAFEKEMDAAKADWQFVDFSGAVHCFTQPESKGPGNCAYNERAAKRASLMMRNFFSERFGTL